MHPPHLPSSHYSQPAHAAKGKCHTRGCTSAIRLHQLFTDLCAYLPCYQSGTPRAEDLMCSMCSLPTSLPWHMIDMSTPILSFSGLCLFAFAQPSLARCLAHMHTQLCVCECRPGGRPPAVHPGHCHQGSRAHGHPRHTWAAGEWLCPAAGCAATDPSQVFLCLQCHPGVLCHCKCQPCTLMTLMR